MWENEGKRVENASEGVERWGMGDNVGGDSEMAGDSHLLKLL
jgi:hypothetical protein